MRRGFRNRVWRELPFSARRALLSTMRTVDQIDEWIAETWQSLHRSPAWLFVAAVGTLGVILTLLLFLSLSRELLAGGAHGRRGRPIIEPPVPVFTSEDLIDSRMCLEAAPQPTADYAANFVFADDRSWAYTPRTPLHEPKSPAPEPVFDDPPPVLSPRPTVPATDAWTEFESRTPQLEPRVVLLRQGSPSGAVESHVRTFTSRSEFVEHLRHELSILPQRSDGWMHHREHAIALIEPPPRYAGESADWTGGVIGAHATENDAFADAGAWNNRAEIAVRVELHAPERAALLQPGRSFLVIRNTGNETIRRLQVLEPMHRLDRVAAATPGGQVRDDLLQREVLRLHAGRDKTLSLEWFPISKGERHHHAQILTEAYVAATVQVISAQEELRPAAPVESLFPEAPASSLPPRPQPALPVEAEPVREPLPTRKVELESPRAEVLPLEPRLAVQCAVRSRPSIQVGDVAEFAVEVRNTGDVSLHNVKVWADVPRGLRHRYGTALECTVGRLAAGESKQVTLRAIGDQRGVLVASFRVLADESVQTVAQARLAVVNDVPSLVRPARAMLESRADAYCDCRWDCGAWRFTP